MNSVKTMIVKNDKWVEIDFKDLKPHDNFQLINPDGSYHEDEFGYTNWIAISEAYINKDGVYTVDTL